MERTLTEAASQQPTGQVQQKDKEEQEKQRKPTILVAGYTGSRKTSLIQAIFGQALGSEDRIGHSSQETTSFDCYQNQDFRVLSSKGLERGEETEQRFIREIDCFLKRPRKDGDVAEDVHVVWYCIDGSRAHITSCDVGLIKRFWYRVIVLVTKSDITRPHQHATMAQSLAIKGIDPRSILPVSIHNGEELERLKTLTMCLMPVALRSALVAPMRLRLWQSFLTTVIACGMFLSIHASLV